MLADRHDFDREVIFLGTKIAYSTKALAQDDNDSDELFAWRRSSLSTLSPVEDVSLFLIKIWDQRTELQNKIAIERRNGRGRN
jgi:hypothetical protein